jgi:hypothetical protein
MGETSQRSIREEEERGVGLLPKAAAHGVIHREHQVRITSTINGYMLTSCKATPFH